MSVSPELNPSVPPPEVDPPPYDIEDVSVAPLIPDEDDVQSIYVAPNWKLIWWRFKKHKLAVFSTVVVLMIATVAMFPGFFSTQDPNESDAKELFIPPQRLHFFDDGSLKLYVYAVDGVRNPETLRMEWQTNYEEKIYLQLFARGYPYEVLGLIETEIHLFGLADPESDETFHFLGTDRLGRDQWSRLIYGTR
ncbi:MAG: hypothetical protein ACK2U0_10610, partial [Candidatus Promineifilaceae bacterium]